MAARRTRAHWSEERAENELRSLELFGMRFGLERMRRLMTALGSPQRSYHTIQVLGTNGKTSTTRMIAAILSEHGLDSGAYLSPHLVSYRERILVRGEEIDGRAFADAVARASHAAHAVDRTLAEDDHITQFELLTAAALAHFAQAGVEVAVVEAGLGGRYDATSVVDAPIRVLTNVGLEHTRWLGPTVRDIAREKLAVLAPGTTLIVGADLDADARAVADELASERGATVSVAAAGQRLRLAAAGAFQQRNFALAQAAATAQLAALGVAVDADALARAGASTLVPGRAQMLDAEPPTLLDGAHNPAAVDALAESLPELLGDRPLALVLGVLDDKDAAGMLAALLPLSERAYFTAPASPRALPPATLLSLAAQQGYQAGRCEPRPELALAQAQQWARENAGAVLVTGSVYLVGAILAARANTAPEEARA